MDSALVKKSNEMLLPEQLDELREFLEDLNVVPLSFLPPEVWPIVFEYQNKLRNDEITFDNPIEENMRLSLNARLRDRKKQREKDNQTDLLQFNF